MFDLNSIVKKRYFTCKIGKIVLDVKPPKLKVLKKLTSIAKTNDNDELYDAMKFLLGSNKQNIKVDNLVDNLDTDELNILLTNYFEWVDKNKNSPN